ncbi:VOC family protein [Pseudonocardia kunmingensis]|uniref:Putative enzyme related to lactoylglutathione lyase n=1 Tax=Pseudonocardia kunmingensis TaxID=630975 RepID=A0A543DZN7_9PSEU|nr:VOC family protein [Pseudonocardia kunmingensis]TQM14821.1 putative enzyme related to lactoylglutathione lyase [Pseudonocardia kunmingensis]
MFRGFATMNLYADDLAAARDWYAELFGVEAYYAYPSAPATPAYVEFRIGDDGDEIGLIDRRYAPPGAANAPGGAVMYWHVDDLESAVDRLIALGAREYQPITEHGDGSGFVTASVVDPFGNLFGVMNNPHYIEVAAGRAQTVATPA